MEIDEGAFEFGRPQIIAAALIFVSILAVATLFAFTGIIANDLLTFKLDIVLEKLISVNTLLFLVAFALPFAITIVLGKRMEKTNLMLVSGIASVAGVAVSMLAFPALQGFLLFLVFYLIAIQLSIDKAFVRYAELKSRVTARTTWDSTSRAISVMSLGLAIFAIVAIVPEHEQFLEKFEDFMTDMTFDMSSGRSGQELSESAKQAVVEGAANTIIESQKEALNQVLDDSGYETLRDKADADVVTFVNRVDLYRAGLETDVYREDLEQRLRIELETEGVLQTLNVEESVQKIEILDMMRQSIPVIQTLERFMPLGIWIGLGHAILIAGIFSFLGLIFVKPAAVAIALVTEQALSGFGEETVEVEAEE